MATDTVGVWGSGVGGCTRLASSPCISMWHKYCLHVQKIIAFKHVGQKHGSLVKIHQKAASKATWNMWLTATFYVSYRWVNVMRFIKFNVLNKTISVLSSKAPNTFLPEQINQYIPLQWYHVLRVDKVFFFLISMVLQKLTWVIGFNQNSDTKNCLHGIICLRLWLFFSLRKHSFLSVLWCHACNYIPNTSMCNIYLHLLICTPSFVLLNKISLKQVQFSSILISKWSFTTYKKQQ